MQSAKFKDKHDHAEAFCAMQYECENCKSIEVIWNSRDGVTPLCITSGCCEGHISQHTRFEQDVYYPSFPFHLNIRRVFVNHTKESAKDAANKFFDKVGEKMMEQFPHLKELGKEKLIESKCNEIYGNGDRPRVVEVEELIKKSSTEE